MERGLRDSVWSARQDRDKEQVEQCVLSSVMSGDCLVVVPCCDPVLL